MTIANHSAVNFLLLGGVFTFLRAENIYVIILLSYNNMLICIACLLTGSSFVSFLNHVSI